MEIVERILFYKLNEKFSEKYNGHTFLTDHKIIPNLYQRIDQPMYVSPEMNKNNLTIQYTKKQKESISIKKDFRFKYMLGGLEQYPKLASVETKKSSLSQIYYNTLSLDSFVLLPELEHQILLKKVEKVRLELHVVLNSLSWKITAPLRWLGFAVKKVTRIFK